MTTTTIIIIVLAIVVVDCPARTDPSSGPGVAKVGVATPPGGP